MPKRQTAKTPHRRLRCLMAPLLCGCAVAIAACGSSATSTSAASTSYAAALRYTVCLRSHGVPDFPDPGPDGGIVPITAGSGINPQAPAVQSAEQACAKLNPIAQTTPQSYTASQKRAALEQAACMRRHGVPGYPDPSYGRYGTASRPIEMPLLASINPQSPAFTAAEKACQTQ